MAQASPVTQPSRPLSHADLRALADRFTGRLISPGDGGYDEARAIWNGMIDKRPALIARCSSTQDVVAAVNFARERDLLVAVRGGGHNVAGNAVCDGGIVIDLSHMKSVRVDAGARIASAEPGLVWGEFDSATHQHGLAMPGGIQSTTGIAGFTLGGGFGWLTRRYGLTCDHLLSADVVTAGAHVLKANRDENPDLFWGLRGGGGNFGVVASFEYCLHPASQVLGGMVVHPFAKAREVLKFYREFVAAVPEQLGTIVFFLTGTNPQLPEALRNAPIIVVGACFDGPLEEGEAILKPLREFGPPGADFIKPAPYPELQKMVDAANPPGRQNYWKSSYFSGYSDEVIDVLCELGAAKPPGLSKVLLTHFGGAVSRVAADETAFGHRDAPFILNINAMWADPRENDAHIAWATEFWTAMQPFSTGGVYVNFLGTEGEDRVKAAYEPQTYAKLAALKKKYDPTNFFRLNQNIKPAP